MSRVIEGRKEALGDVGGGGIEVLRGFWMERWEV